MDLRMFDEGGKLCKVLLVSSTFNLVITGARETNPKLFNVKDLSTKYSRWGFMSKDTLDSMFGYKKVYV